MVRHTVLPPLSAWPFIGHDVLGQLMVQSLDAGLMPDVSFFVGPAHLGKASAAVWLAQRERCQQPDTRPCQVCPSCRQINTGHHPLVITLDQPSPVISIDEIRLALARWPTRPTSDEHRWLIIPEVERLTEGAANALLKFLEDVPSRTHVIMTSSYPASVLPTVRSRAATYRWHLIRRDMIDNWLKEIAPELSSTARMAITNRAAGRPGIARDVLSNGITEGELVTQCIDSFSWVEQSVTAAPSADLFLTTNLGSLVVREVLLNGQGADHRLWPHLSARFSTLAQHVSPRRWLQLLDRYAMASQSVRSHPQVRLFWYDLRLV